MPRHVRHTREEKLVLAAQIAFRKSGGQSHRVIAKALNISAGYVSTLHRWFLEQPEYRCEAPIPVPVEGSVPADGPLVDSSDSLTEVDPDVVTYLKEQDIYLVRLRGDFGTQAFEGGQVRSMRKAYSRYAGSPTMREVAHAHGLTRHHFDAIRHAMGWTKNDLPVTDEELSTKSEDEVIGGILALKAQRIEAAVEKRIRAAEVKDAQKWRDAMASFGDDLRAEVKDLLREEPVWPSATSSAPEAPTGVLLDGSPAYPKVVVLGLSDWHYGMFADPRATGAAYDLDTAVRRLKDAWDFISQRLADGVTDVVLPISGDLFHVDNEMAQTTKGTPQDVVNDVGLMARGFLRAMRDFIEELRHFGTKVHLVPVHGNHDSLVGKMTMVSLAMLYETSRQVQVHEVFTPNSLLELQGNLLYFAHGDGLKPKDMPMYVAAEHAEAWGRCGARVGFSGHVHHEVVKEFPGFKHFTMPSLASTDRWHAKQGYSSKGAGMAAYILEPRLGVTQQVFAPAIR